MGLFSSKQPSYLGIDLGLNGVKVVELRNNKGRSQLLTYGFAEEGGEVSREEYFANTDRIATIIKNVCDKANTTSKQVIASLPTYSVFDSIITLPFMPPKELKKAIEEEAKKLITRPLDEMVLYWNILNQGEMDLNNKKRKKTKLKPGEQEKDIIISKEIKHLKIFLTAAPKEFINKYVEIFQKAGLRLLSLETAAFALTRSLVGMDHAPIVITDIGAGTTEIIILNQGLPVFSRSINLGGYHISQALQKSLNISLEESEQLKSDLSDSPGEEAEIMLGKIRKVIDPIVHEIKYSINLYFNRLAILDKGVVDSEQEARVEKVILTGGSSSIFGLSDYLKKELKTRVFVGDPWARVIYPQDLKPVLDEIGPSMGIAVGLAMRDIS